MCILQWCFLTFSEDDIDTEFRKWHSLLIGYAVVAEVSQNTVDVSSYGWGQFHQHAYNQLLRAQICRHFLEVRNSKIIVLR